MHSKELHTLVQSGVRPVVTFRKGVEESETYLEAGMRGRITGSRAAHDGLFHFTVDLTGFEEINAGFETANYYDKEGAAVLTARQAGFYPEDGLEALYVDADLANILELVPDARPTWFTVAGIAKDLGDTAWDFLLPVREPRAVYGRKIESGVRRLLEATLAVAG